jgi:predicted RNA binding protein YcfA (HicA-like mRNA interferase family)
MTKLPVVSARECVRALEKAGFVVSRQRDSHIKLKRLNPKARVVVPNHKTIKPGTLRTILREADLTVEEFIEFLNE